MQLTQDVVSVAPSLPAVVILDSPPPAPTAPRAQRVSFPRRLWLLLTLQGPIQQKLLVFSGGLAAWIVLLGSLAALSVDKPGERVLIIGLTLISVVPLAGMGVLLTRALTRPIRALGCQMKALTDRYSGQTEDDGQPIAPIVLAEHDEVGKLAARFNQLTATLQDINSFKKVIEGDDTTTEVYDRLGHQLAVLGLDDFVIYEASNSKNRLLPVVTSSSSAAEACSPDIRLDSSLCRAKKTGAVVSSASFPQICRYFCGGEREHICVPMNIAGSTGGVVQFLFDRNEDDPQMEEAHKKVRRGRRFLREALPVIEAKRLMSTLKQSTLRDAMTGLHNRRFLEEYADTLVATAERRKAPIGLVMCDLDFFKEVNDTHGHDVGDTVLRRTAEIIRQAVRGADIAVRYGGEEFLVVLTDASAEGPMLAAERIRKAIEAERFPTPQGAIKKTISLGVSELGTDTKSFWQAIKFADVALYKAKEAGRNRALRFASEMWPANEY